MKRKTNIAWGIKCKTGIILPFSIRHTRRDAIKDMESNYKASWNHLKKQGMTVVKVEIREFQKLNIFKPVKDPSQPFPQLKITFLK
ncbi:hypothetical protein CHU00_17530 [Sphingobacterium cellulitidis]|uniref:hypothetical protein n=1 Tax=Sphingobacterium cellulitidis TaxID=1768011 RepID=UPI000B941066|nr:hypothetical protein [Sphingobacterium cellulitidis]OYD44310.1 hypothetical protein CHU00_17530 [Sphingobacterium cellulitidis]